MGPEPALNSAQRFYRALVQLYPAEFRAMFGDSLLQTFTDLCREADTLPTGKKRLILIRLFIDTAVGISVEQARLLSITMKNKPLAILGLIMLIPFGLVFVVGLTWQLLHVLGYANIPDMGALVPNQAIAFALVFILPGVASAVNGIALVVSAVRDGPKGVLTLQFVKSNLVSGVVVALSAGAVVFAFGHDTLPCLAFGILRQGLGNLLPLLQTCAQV